TACLVEPGKLYPLPFGDHSTVPTSHLATAVAQRLEGRPRIVLDGTGADGAFGLTGKAETWQKVARTPRMVRSVASSLYGRLLWGSTGHIERLLRVTARTTVGSLESALVAQNPLAGAFYSADQRAAVDAELSRWV